MMNAGKKDVSKLTITELEHGNSDQPSSESAEQLSARCAQQSKQIHQLNAMLNATNSNFALLDLDFNFLFVNSAYAAGSGYTQEELVNQNLFDLFPDEESRKIFQRVANTGEPFFFTERPFRYENQPWKETTWWNISLVPVRDPHGQVYALLLTLTDVTELRTTKDKQARLLAELEATVQAIAAGLIVFDTNRKVHRMNKAAEELIGAPLEELTDFIQVHLPKFKIKQMDGTELDMADSPIDHAYRGEVVRGVTIAVEPSSQPNRATWFNMNAAPIMTNDNNMLGVVITFADVTTLHELQMRQKSLMQVLSHDLRAPLTVIKAHGQMLKKQMQRLSVCTGAEAAEGKTEKLGKPGGLVGDSEQGLTDRITTSIQAIIKSQERMERMIQDLTDLTQLEGGQLQINLRPIIITEYLADLLDRISPIIDGERIESQVPDTLPLVLADPNQLDRILLNLLTNAIKYSHPNSKIKLSVTLSEETPHKEIILSVSDKGPGISPEDLPHIFDQFFRTQSSRIKEGIGLGLHITRLLVEAHGGHIWATSTVDKGSTFSFTIPIAI